MNEIISLQIQEHAALLEQGVLDRLHRRVHLLQHAFDLCRHPHRIAKRREEAMHSRRPLDLRIQRRGGKSVAPCACRAYALCMLCIRPSAYALCIRPSALTLLHCTKPSGGQVKAAACTLIPCTSIAYTLVQVPTSPEPTRVSQTASCACATM